MKMDSDRAKLFVGGISRETTEDVLKDHFTKYGSVLGSTISVDRGTGIPRGFGFVKFSDLSEADKALQDTHVILGRTVEVKKAIPRSDQQHQYQQQSRVISNCSSNDSSSDQFRTKKIFVGGLSASISEEEFRKYFETFGRITDVVVMQDSLTHRPRGFGFITFDSEESVENVMVKSFHDLNGRQVEVKRAVPKEGNYGTDGFYRMKNKSGRGGPRSSPHYSPTYMLPGFAPLPWYSSDGSYIYGSNIYNCWYPMSGYAVPSDPPRNFWYQPMITGSQSGQVPFVNASPSAAYANGRVRMVGSGTRVHNGIRGTTTNFKLDQVSSVNGFVPAGVQLPQIEGVTQKVDSLSLKVRNDETPS